MATYAKAECVIGPDPPSTLDTPYSTDNTVVVTSYGNLGNSWFYQALSRTADSNFDDLTAIVYADSKAPNVFIDTDEAGGCKVASNAHLDYSYIQAKMHWEDYNCNSTKESILVVFTI